MDLQKIFYAKVEGTFKPPSLRVTGTIKHQGPKPFPAKDFAKETLRSIHTGLDSRSEEGLYP
jgi:hypothetical protein